MEQAEVLERDLIRRVLLKVADNLAARSHGFDYGEMDAEVAFDLARDACVEAIRDAVRAELG
jgi:hypothetical protein